MKKVFRTISMLAIALALTTLTVSSCAGSRGGQKTTGETTEKGKPDTNP